MCGDNDFLNNIPAPPNGLPDIKCDLYVRLFQKLPHMYHQYVYYLIYVDHYQLTIALVNIENHNDYYSSTTDIFNTIVDTMAKHGIIMCNGHIVFFSCSIHIIMYGFL